MPMDGKKSAGAKTKQKKWQGNKYASFEHRDEDWGTRDREQKGREQESGKRGCEKEREKGFPFCFACCTVSLKRGSFCTMKGSTAECHRRNAKVTISFLAGDGGGLNRLQDGIYVYLSLSGCPSDCLSPHMALSLSWHCSLCLCPIVASSIQE
mmetsp:Transcript_41907/g.82757  ORF Transcript_41907/g.82757 Transcript_41907/m.82757 type:complete len:153 (-) Transcript_41907:1258-1716(-)